MFGVIGREHNGVREDGNSGTLNPESSACLGAGVEGRDLSNRKTLENDENELLYFRSKEPIGDNAGVGTIIFVEDTDPRREVYEPC